MISVTKSITANGEFTESIAPTENFDSPKIGHLTFSIEGTASWSATIAIQRSFDAGVTWVTVNSYTDDTEKAILDKTDGVIYRIGSIVYSSGTIAVRLSK